jgi:hypothetical protein
MLFDNDSLDASFFCRVWNDGWVFVDYAFWATQYLGSIYEFLAHGPHGTAHGHGLGENPQVKGNIYQPVANHDNFDFLWGYFSLCFSHLGG